MRRSLPFAPSPNLLKWPTLHKRMLAALVSSMVLAACTGANSSDSAGAPTKKDGAPADTKSEAKSDSKPEAKGENKAEGKAGAEGKGSEGRGDGRGEGRGGEGKGGGEKGPPAAVTTVVAALVDLPTVMKTAGTVMPMQSVVVRPQSSNAIAAVHVQEGQMVKAGQLLFTLDARLDQANLEKARAQQAKDEAALADVRRQFARAKELVAKGFISRGAADASQTQVQSLEATIKADQAAVQAAQVPLSFANIKAPLSGRVGAIGVYAGSLVQSGQTTMLTITPLDPILVGFALPQRYLGDALQALQNGADSGKVQVTSNGQTLTGHLSFVDSAVDPASGTVQVKAKFHQNTGGSGGNSGANNTAPLWPGASVQVQFVASTLKQVLVVPTSAVMQNAKGTAVYTVLEDKGELKAELKPIKVLLVSGDQSAVEGIAAGDAVVLDGRENVRPGGKVRIAKPGEKGERGGKGEGRGEGRGEGKGEGRGEGKGEHGKRGDKAEGGEKPEGAPAQDVAKPAEKPTDKASEKPTEKTADKAAAPTSDKPAEKSGEHHHHKSKDNAAEATADNANAPAPTPASATTSTPAPARSAP